MMKMSAFLQTLDDRTPFEVRRVMERLRDGLFDPLGVQLLTAHETKLNQAFDQGISALKKKQAAHLCICGAYGQGKSHSLTYLRQRAHQQKFVTSQINLDPREIPFHNFRQVYQALVSDIHFPDAKETSFINQWKNWCKKNRIQETGTNLKTLLPDDMPHVFKAVLVALVQENMRLSQREKGLKKHAAFRPREFPYVLGRALRGEVVPVYRLRHALKYRQVSFYREAGLTCKGNAPWLQMVLALPRLFQQMGYAGWVLLFDEGEAIVQTRITSRSKSYQLLHRMLTPEFPLPGFYPILAFTDDFFMQVQQEDYDRVCIRKKVEIPCFDRDYANAWQQLNVYRLHDLTPKEWHTLCEKLIILHGRAYGWQPPKKRAREALAICLKYTRDQEARLKLKALVEQLDIIHQNQLFNES
jgi:hypothetical protein